MASVRDLFKKQSEEEKKAKTETARQSAKDLFKSDNAKTAAKQIQERYQNWVKNSQDFFNSSNRRYKDYDASNYRADASDWVSTVSKQREWFTKEADNIDKLLASYEDYFDDKWVTGVRDSLQAASREQDKVLKYAQQDLKYWSQWSGAEEYNKAYDNYTYGTKYKDSSYADIQKAIGAANGREKDWLTANADSYMSSADAQAEIDRLEDTLPSGVKGFFQGWAEKMGFIEDDETDDDTRDRIAQLEGIRDTAARQEKIDRYDQYKDDELFESKAGRGASFSNPTAEELNEYQYLLDRAYSAVDKTAPDGGAAAEAEVERLEENPVKVRNKVHFYFENPGLKGIAIPAMASEDAWERVMNQGLKYNWDELTEEEIKMYDYLLYNNGEKAADQYLEDIQVVLDKRATDALNANAKKTIEEGGWLTNIGMSLVSLPTNVFGGMLAFTDNTLNQIAGKPINPYSPAQSFRNFSTTVRGEIGSEIADKATWELFGQNVMQQVYNSGMSMGDSLLGAVTMGKAYSLAAGSGAAASQAAQLYERGASNEQIFWGGVAAGAAEAVFEYVSLDKLLKAKNPETVGQFVWEVLKQAGVEGSEEVATELANLITDGIVMGSQSDLSLAIKRYEEGYYDENGIYHESMSHEDAVKKAMTDKVCDVVWAGISGMLSGGGSSTIMTGVQAGQNVSVGKDVLKNGNVSSLIEIGQAGTDGSQAKSIADRLAKRQEGGKKLSPMAVGALQNTALAERQATLDGLQRGQGREYVPLSDIRQALADVDVENAAELAQVIDRAQRGEASEKELMALAGNEKASEILKKVTEESTLRTVSKGVSALEDIEKITSVNTSEGKKTDAPEFARYDKTGNGVTTLAESGEEIRIESVVEAKDGELTFRLADGREVSSSEVTYGSSAEAELYAEFARSELQPGVIAAAVRQYDGSVSPKDYARGVETAYLYGWAGISPKEVASLPQTAVLNEVQRSFAYDLGRVRAVDEDTKKSTKLKSLVENSRKKSSGKKGRVILEGVDSRGRLNEQQKASKGFCETAAKILGVNIHLYESDVLDGARGYTKQDGNRITDNGFYDPQTGDIWLDINAGIDGRGLTVFTLAHELAHFVRQWSPEKFRVLSDFLMETYGKKGVSVEDLVSAQQSYAKEQGRELTFREAWEEVVADSMEMLLNDGRVMERVAALKKRDGTLADKIIGYIRRFVDRVQKAYEGITADSAEGKTVAGWAKEEIEGLQDRFADALYDASETFKKTDVSQMETSEGVKNQARSEYRQEITQWQREGMPDGELFVLGYTGDVLQGLGAIESDIYMLGDKIKTILADHTEMTLEEIKKIPQILEDPILILKSRNVGRGNRDNTRLVIFGAVKATNGQPVLSVLDIRPKEGRLVIDDMQKVVSAYTKDNDPVSYVKNSDVLYADKKRTASLLRTIGFQTPIELNVSGSIGSISYSGQNVNIEGKKFSEVFSENVRSEKSSMRRERASNRSLLVSALESTAQNETERERLREYKEKIGELNAAEERLGSLNRQIREIAFGKGPRDFAKLADLRAEADRIANRIQHLDRSLLSLEATAPLLRILDEAKKEAAKKAKATAEKRAQETEDRRDRTVMRDKIKKKVNELNRLLVKPTKEKHIPNWLQRPAVELLSAINSENDRAVRYYGQRAAELQESLREAVRKQKILDDKYQNAEVGSDTETALQEQLNEVGETIKTLQAELKSIEGKYYKASEKLKAMVDAYKRILGNDNPEIAEGYHPEIADKLDELAATVGDIPISAMTVQELDVVYQAITVLDTAIRNANKFFNQSRSETITATAETVYTELRRFQRKLQTTGTGGIPKVMTLVKQLGVKNLKPYVAAKLIGSDTLSSLLEEMADSETIWARDMAEAKAYYETVRDKTGADQWDMDKPMTLKLGGNDVNLSLGQVMSLYAYSRRKQAIKHLVDGGFVHGNEQEIKTLLGRKNKVSEKPNRLTERELATIGDKLTEEQREFVQRMQSYLSVTMAKKGNAVSEKLYGIDLFGEEFYFPIKSKDSYLRNDEKKDAEGERRTKNLGMTKATVSHADNPVVLSDFMKVWDNHVNDMSLYHGVLGVEDFTRVWDTKFRQDNGDTVSLKETVKAYCGQELYDYFEQLIKDANKGVRKQSDSPKLVETMISRMKKGATYASLSVFIQQRTSEARAYAYIPERFFEKMPRRLLPSQHRKAWEEMKKHCPLAVIKEMGGYDMTGGSTEKWIAGSPKLADKIDDIAGWLPAHADEITWVRIWEASKNMAASLRDSKTGKPLYEKGSPEMIRKAAEIASECLRKTQVYDSVFTRSAWMRSQGTMEKMVTAFMAEPTTTVNMLIDSALNLKRGGKVKTAGREISARRMAFKSLYVAELSVIAASLAKAVIMAMRDDDEEKTYVEKYLYHASGDLVESLDPFGMVPWVQDVLSIFQGYDVSRNDLQIVSDIKRAIDTLQSEEASWDMKLLKVATPISSMLGIPVGNVMKDLRGMYYTLFRTPPLSETTGVGLKDALLGEESSNGELLYEAYLSGDTKAIERYAERFKTDEDAMTAIRKIMRERDSRVREAALARMAGDWELFEELMSEMKGEKIFDAEQIRMAVNSEENAIRKKQKNDAEDTETVADPEETVTSLYRVVHVNEAFERGDAEDALHMIEEMISTKMENGKTEKEARASVKSGMTSYWKPLYREADKARREEILAILVESGLYGTKTEARKTAQAWLDS